jgi:hypothetical protein
MTSWAAARAVLQGRSCYVPDAQARLEPEILSARERRRSTATVRLALEVCQQAVNAAGAELANLPSVFSSASGDLDILDYMCKTLAGGETALSPTRFHNSVYNAPAGYWTIGTGCHAPSSSLSAGDESFAAGLLEASLRALSISSSVLFVAYDAPAPFPVSEAYPITVPFGAALVLTADAGAWPIVAALDLDMYQGPTGSGRVVDASLDRLRRANPIAASLPLLAALAARVRAQIVLALSRSAGLAVEVAPSP